MFPPQQIRNFHQEPFQRLLGCRFRRWLLPDRVYIPTACRIPAEHLPEGIQLFPAKDVFKTPPEGNSKRIFCLCLFHGSPAE